MNFFGTAIRRFSRDWGNSQRHLALQRRLTVEPLEQRAMLSIEPNSIINPVAPTGIGDVVQSSSAVQYQTVANLPAAAQQSISSAIGQDQFAYHALSGAVGVTLANPANSFTAQLQSGALQVSTGLDTWDMALAGLVYDGAIQPVGTAQTSVNGNRVDFNYGMIDEWYVNGPSGLEQGFIVQTARNDTSPSPAAAIGITASPAQDSVTPLPPSEETGSLTLELTLGGDLKGTVNAAGDGLTLDRPDGSTALGYTGLVAYDATGKVLPASLELQADGNHQDLLIHVDDAGAQGPITIDPFVQEAKLTASDGASGDAFGTSVSISGNTVVVGAPDANNGQGAAYVFTEPSSGWADMTQVAKLIASDGAADDDFGVSVSISGNTIVVGADGATVGGNSQQGAAYVFAEPASGWANMTQTAKLTAPNGLAEEELGVSVSISGNTLVVGADNPFDLNARGAAYVFTKSASGWASRPGTAELTASDGTASDYFGSSVSISGSTIAVGAWQATVGTSVRQGAAYVFAEPASGWTDMTQSAKLTASDGALYDYFGVSVSISNNTIVVGAFNAIVGGTSPQGAAYVFVEPASGWANMTQTAKLAASDGQLGDYFGDLGFYQRQYDGGGRGRPPRLAATASRGRPTSSWSRSQVGQI